jgi:hypothetical protein
MRILMDWAHRVVVIDLRTATLVLLITVFLNCYRGHDGQFTVSVHHLRP